MSNVYLCSQIPAFDSENGLKHAQGLAEQLPYFNGAVFVVNWNFPIADLSDSETFGYLKHQCAKQRFNNPNFNFEVIPNRWINFNNIPMIMFLQVGVLQNNDWCVWLDSQEKLKPKFLEGLKDRIKRYDQEGYTSAWWGRPYLFKYHDKMTFEGNPHCFPGPLLAGKQDDLRDESAVRYEENGVHFSDFLFNGKKFENSYILSAFKYIWCYSVSNELVNQYGTFGSDVVNHHEGKRMWFRNYCKTKLGIDTTIEGITEYFSKRVFDDAFIEYVEFETIFKDFFRLRILKHSLNTILSNRNHWSFKEYLKTGDELQKNSVYINTRNRYNQLNNRSVES